MSKPTKLTGVVPASVAPFDSTGRVDEAAFMRLLEWNIGQGAESFFIGGSSAECFLLDFDERIALFRMASKLKEKAFLTAHVGAISTGNAMAYAREAAAAVVFIVAAASSP